jgi:hypothetical protein
MNDNLLHQRNIQNIKNQIFIKNNSQNTYYATTMNNKNVITEYDHFPYTRFWKGIPKSSHNYVDSREAGWNRREDKCYKGCGVSQEMFPPQVCFQYTYAPQFCEAPLTGNQGGNCVLSYR